MKQLPCLKQWQLLPCLFSASLFLLCTCVRAQEILPQGFLDRLSAIEVELHAVPQPGFRVREPTSNAYLDDHLVLYSKAEKLEVRFHLKPTRGNDPMADMPHLRAHTLAMNLGSNDEDAVTTVHSFGEEELAVLHADWARMYTFRPKTGYSPRAHAQLIAVYRRGQGLAYTILLFDKPPPTLEDRQLCLRFL